MHELILNELLAQFYAPEQICTDRLVKKLLSVFRYLTFFHLQTSLKFIRPVSKEHQKQFSSDSFCQSPLLIKLQGKPTTLSIKGSNASTFLWIMHIFSEHLFCRTLLRNC